MTQRYSLRSHRPGQGENHVLFLVGHSGAFHSASVPAARGEPERGRLSLVIQMLKQITSRKLRPAAGLPADDAGSVGQLKRFWQVRYHDFPVWTEAKRIPPVSLRSRVGMTIARRSCSPWIGRAARGLEVEQLRALRHGRWWILNRNGPHGSENGWEWCRRFRRPTLPPKPREGWGNLWWRNSERMGQPPRSCHPEVRAFCGPKDLWSRREYLRCRQSS